MMRFRFSRVKQRLINERGVNDLKSLGRIVHHPLHHTLKERRTSQKYLERLNEANEFCFSVERIDMEL